MGSAAPRRWRLPSACQRWVDRSRRRRPAIAMSPAGTLCAEDDGHSGRDTRIAPTDDSAHRPMSTGYAAGDVRWNAMSTLFVAAVVLRVAWPASAEASRNDSALAKELERRACCLRNQVRRWCPASAAPRVWGSLQLDSARHLHDGSGSLDLRGAPLTASPPRREGMMASSSTVRRRFAALVHSSAEVT